MRSYAVKNRKYFESQDGSKNLLFCLRLFRETGWKSSKKKAKSSKGRDLAIRGKGLK